MSDLKAMRTLLAIRDSGSLTMASLQMDEPKSTLSRRISILETELDEKLTYQNGRRMSLTEAGLCYAGYCEQILQLDYSARQAVKGLRSTLSGKITVGLSTDFSRGWATESLHNFMKKFPDITLEVKILDCAQLTEDPSIDLWVSCCSEKNQSGVRSRLIGSWEQGLYCCHSENRMSNIEQLKTHHWICSHQNIDDIRFDFHGKSIQFQPEHSTVISSVHMRADAILQGFGIGFLPLWVAECKRHGIHRFQRLFPELVIDRIELWLHSKVDHHSLIVNTLKQWIIDDIPDRWK